MRWEDRIDEAEKRGGFTVEDIDLAAEYRTCACGEQDPRIERWQTNGDPKDWELSKLGVAFVARVCRHDFAGAREQLAKIEQRAAQVLREQGVV